MSDIDGPENDGNEENEEQEFTPLNWPDTISIVDEMRQSYRDYSMSVIIGRALPDIRDGLKPVHRRVLYAMFSEGLLSNKKYSKCAGVVGEVLKKYHPHGDSSVYEALVRLAQPWNMGGPLVDGQGNFGSIDGDRAAAYRYTEARLTKLAEELLRDIEKNTVDFIPNFDGSHTEPSVLPSRVPNLLINGSEGIAVAMATRCPPYNLREVCDALLATIGADYEGGEALTTDTLMEIMKGPDFPTGGIITGRAGIRSAYETGKGSIKMRGVAEIVDNPRNNRQQIIITEIPFQVNKARLVEKTAHLVRDKKIEGISEIRDESDRDGMRIAIDLKRDAIGDVVLNQLYKHTPLQGSFPVHQLAIVKGQPRTLPMQDMLDDFLAYRREIVTRRTRFELDACQKRFHLIAGLLCALDDIDRVITIIRSAKTTEEAKNMLCEEKFQNATQIGLFTAGPTKQIEGWLEQGYAQLDPVQAQSILDMRLSKLVGLEREKLTKEGEELLVEIERLKEILADILVLMKLIKTEIIEIRDQYSWERRTEITGAVEDLNIEDLIAEEDMVVTISHTGYIKRAALSQYRAQRRGGKGRSATKNKDEDFLSDAFVASTHAYLLIFTNVGKVYWLKVHRIPEGSPQSRGRPIINLIQMEEGEHVKAILPVRHFPDEEGKEFVLTASRNGQVKKTDLMQYSRPRNSGLKACGINDGDELIEVKITSSNMDVLLCTKDGYAMRFKNEDVRPMGRTASGVRGIRLREDDEVVSMTILEENISILTVTERGYGKRTAVAEYPVRNRGGKGVITIKTTLRNGRVASAVQVRSGDEVMILTDNGTLLRVKSDDVSEFGRNTQGVKIINVSKNEAVTSVSRIVEADEADEDETEGQELAVDGEEAPTVVVADSDSGEVSEIENTEDSPETSE